MCIQKQKTDAVLKCVDYNKPESLYVVEFTEGFRWVGCHTLHSKWVPMDTIKPIQGICSQKIKLKTTEEGLTL